VRIDVRVKISWHPHPAYPPLSTLKAGLFAFTRTLRGIDPYWIPIFTEDAQELHRNPSNFLKFDSISNHNEWYLQGFRYNSHFLFQIARSQAAEGRLRGREGWIDEQSYQIDQYEARVLLCTHVERPSPGPEAGLLTLMIVCDIGVCVFLWLVSVVSVLMFRNLNEFDAKVSFFIDFVSASGPLKFFGCVFDGFLKSNVLNDLWSTYKCAYWHINIPQLIISSIRSRDLSM
jgi:hypothetical protein